MLVLPALYSLFFFVFPCHSPPPPTFSLVHFLFVPEPGHSRGAGGRRECKSAEPEQDGGDALARATPKNWTGRALQMAMELEATWQGGARA